MNVFDRLTSPGQYTLGLAAVVGVLAVYLHLAGALHVEVELVPDQVGPAVHTLHEIGEGLGVLYAAIVMGRGFASRIKGSGENFENTEE